MKRLFSVILAAVLLLTLLPAWGVKSSAKADPDVAATIEKQVRAYADSIDQANADTNAAMDLATHGLRGNGKKLTMGTSSPLTAALLNSELVQKGFAVNFAEIIHAMQRLDMQAVPGVQMTFGWYGADSNYSAMILTDSKKNPDNLDWLVSNEDYTGRMNVYDESLEWMVGQCDAKIHIECVRDSGTEKTYQLTATFADRFDFSTANTGGFKKLLSGLGMRLFKEFDWECTVTMTITAPYSYDCCSHSSGAYHWVYDGENRAMISDGSDGFLTNNTTHRSQTAKDGTVHHYYELDNTIRLYHNKPWVVEYDVRTPVRIVFAPVDNAVTKTHPRIVQSARTSLFVVSKDYAMAENTNGNLDRFYAFNYFGTKLQTLYPFAYGKTYTFRLENVITDGSNRILLSAFDTQTGECCLDRVPMDDYYYYGGWMEETELISEENNWLSGKDIHINYFGAQDAGLDAKELDLRIWENGKDGSRGSYLSEKWYPATCTEDGYTLRQCSRCRFSERLDVVPALGHSFGEWGVTANPTCTAKGAEKRTCATCGHGETREIPALGHAYDSAVTPPGCTSEGYTTHTCSRCGNTYTDSKVGATGHSFGAWEIVTAPGCTTEGQEQHSCTVCGYSEARVVTATGHNHVAEVIAPTCTAAGKTIHTCACGDSYEDSYVPASGHSGGEATCRSMAKCASCGTYYGSRDPEKHAGGTKVLGRVEPTETAEGYSGDTYCKGCDKKLSDGEILPVLPPAEKCRYGDVNHDGRINVTDAVMVMKHRANALTEGDTFCERCANVDGREAINVSDAVLIMKKRANSDMIFPIELQ